MVSELILVNAILSTRNKLKPSIDNGHFISQIEKQLTHDFKEESVSKKAAYLTYSIMILKPFKTLNKETAFVSGILFYQRHRGININQSIASRLSTAIKDESYLDDFVRIYKLQEQQ